MALSRLDMTRMVISTNVFCSIWYTGELKEALFYRFGPCVISSVVAALLIHIRNMTINNVFIHGARANIYKKIGCLLFVNIILGLIFQTYAFMLGTLAVYIPETLQFLRRRIHQHHTPQNPR